MDDHSYLLARVVASLLALLLTLLLLGDRHLVVLQESRVFYRSEWKRWNLSALLVARWLALSWARLLLLANRGTSLLEVGDYPLEESEREPGTGKWGKTAGTVAGTADIPGPKIFDFNSSTRFSLDTWIW